MSAAQPARWVLKRTPSEWLHGPVEDRRLHSFRYFECEMRNLECHETASQLGSFHVGHCLSGAAIDQLE